MVFSFRERHKAAIALISLLVISTLILVLAVTAIDLGINESQLTISDLKRSENSATADACIEETAIQLKQNPNYTGGTLNVGTSTCNISITSSGTNRVATLIITKEQYVTTMEVTFDLTNSGQAVNLILLSVQEI